MENISSTQPLEIPKLIHFIWAGGKVLLKARNVEIIKNWATTHPNYKIFLWIDKKTAPENKDLVEYYNEVFKDLNVECKDIEENKVSSDLVRYEIDRIDPNYGASSDLLRYKILYSYGGAYFDSDINPGSDSLEKFFKDKKFENPVIFIDHLSQMPQPPAQGLERFELEGNIKGTPKNYGIGNDTFICTPNNPLIMRIVEEAEANYKNLNIALRVAYSSHNIKELTIEKTGPTVVSHVIIREEVKSRSTNGKYFICQMNNISVEIHPVRCKDYELTSPIKNFKDWLDVPLLISNINEIYDKLIATIQFELEYLKIIRLEDHLRHLTQILKELGIDEKDCIEKFMVKVKNIEFDYSQIKFAQLVSIDPRVIEFYEEKGLTTKTLLSLDTESFRQVAEWVTSKELFSSLGLILSDEDNTFESLLAKGIYTNQQLLNFVQQLEVGVAFIKKMLQDGSFEKLGSTADDNFCYDLFHNYVNVAKALNDYEGKDLISVKELEDIDLQLQDFFTSKLLFSEYTYEDAETALIEENTVKNISNQQKIYTQSNVNLFFAHRSKDEDENEDFDLENSESISDKNNKKRKKPEEGDDDENNPPTKKTRFNV